MENPECHDTRECFARINGKCIILYDTFEEDGKCPFCKKNRWDVPVHKKKEVKKSNFKHGW